MRRISNFQLFLCIIFFWSFFIWIVRLYGEKTQGDVFQDIKTQIEKRHKMVLSNQLENITAQLKELQSDFKITANAIFEKQKPTKEVDRTSPYIKLLNSGDIDPFHGDILILVNSHVEHKHRRESIRIYWGNSTRFASHRQKFNDTTYKVYFICGYHNRSIGEAKLESRTFKDLLITSRIENYWDFSRRLMFGFLWSIEHCKYNYLLKTDDDVFINIPNLFQLIYEDPFVVEHKDRIYAGLIYPKADPIRDPSNKWYVSKDEWPTDHYPYFATGMTKLLSRLVVERIRPFFDWVHPFRLDDVYVGMLIDRAKIPGIGIRVAKSKKEFSSSHSAEDCTYVEQAVSQHKFIHDWCIKKLTIRSIKH